jgi:hypothetical protein
LGFKKSLCQNAGNAVDLVAVDGANTLSHFALKHANAFTDHGMMLQDLENNFGADMVRKIPNNPPTGFVLSWVLFRIKGYRRAGIAGIAGIPGAGQGIPTKKIPDHLFGLGELVFQQVLDGLLVHLGQPQTVGKFEQVLGELTGSRPDFKQVGVVAPAREG